MKNAIIEIWVKIFSFLILNLQILSTLEIDIYLLFRSNQQVISAKKHFINIVLIEISKKKEQQMRERRGAGRGERREGGRKEEISWKIF